MPELASRRHVTEIVPVVRAALDAAGCTFDDLDALAVTMGPGLAGSLLVGVNVAKSLACARALPLIGVNHLEGISTRTGSPRPDQEDAPEPHFPAVGLIVSGGHTSLVLMTDHCTYRLLGSTLDDAAGEAFDKGARLLGLGYPGGPAIARAAALGDATRLPFAHARTDNPADFSFSGIKTAMLRAVTPYRQPAEPAPERRADTPFVTHRPSVCATMRRQRSSPPPIRRPSSQCSSLPSPVPRGSITPPRCCSPVALRRTACCASDSPPAVDVPLFCPPPIYCTDNAAMIAAAADRRMRAGDFAGWDLDVQPSLRLVASSQSQ